MADITPYIMQLVLTRYISSQQPQFVKEAAQLEKTKFKTKKNGKKKKKKKDHFSGEKFMFRNVKCISTVYYLL